MNYQALEDADGSNKKLKTSTQIEVKATDGFDFEYRGANFAFIALAEEFKDGLFVSLPRLNEIVINIISDYGRRKVTNTFDAAYYQSVSIALNVVIILLPVLNRPQPLEQILDQLLPSLIVACTSSDTTISDLAAQCVASACKHATVKSMQLVIEQMLPLLEKQEDLHARLGVCGCLRHIIGTLGLDILPWVVFLIIPILGRMSDPERQVREQITFNFATLVKLMPLESSIPDPPGELALFPRLTLYRP